MARLAGDEQTACRLEREANELRQKVRYNPSIAGILIVNPDNPTGVVFSRETLEAIIEIAREFDLFVLFDEIYINLVYGGQKRVKQLAI